MRVVFATSEMFPLIKTGGLGDVAFSLPNALAALDVDVCVVMPAYRTALKAVTGLKVLDWLTLADGSEARVLAATHPDVGFRILLVDIPRLYDRDGLPYTDADGSNWPDNAERFARFSEAVALLSNDAPGTGWRADVVHANDWQTGLVPGYLRLQANPPRTVFTIHNIAYDCQLDFSEFQELGLPDDWWTVDYGEYYGRLSMLKAGLVGADLITTVSPRYAAEIRTAEFGYGYADILETYATKLVGVLNGIDDVGWNPKTDPHLSASYHAEGKIRSGKRANREALLDGMSAPAEAHAYDGPLFGFVGRMVYQKGIDLLLEVIPEMLDTSDAQFAIVGSGERELERRLIELTRLQPARVFAYLGYSERLAHLVEAGCDMFVMPSRYEPCGLNQMYSLRYGTPPIVRDTGGLADTVVDTTPRSLAREEANGFVFDQPIASDLQAAMQRAEALYHKPKQWMKLIRIGMRGDYGWRRSAEHYLRLYRDR